MSDPNSRLAKQWVAYYGLTQVVHVMVLIWLNKPTFDICCGSWYKNL